VSLRAPKPLSPKYPKELKKGYYIRKRRLELGIFQREVAERIGVDKDTICLWEANESSPFARYVPRIIQFLGYDPWPTPKTISERLIGARKCLGLTQRAMAKRLRVDPTTLGFWERGERRPSKKLLEMIEAFLRVHQM
jgi:transcriptional regulator with XRE-family HTH domain